MTELLTALSVIFIVAGPFLLVANRFDLPTVPLLILAGLVVGPLARLTVGPLIEEGITLELARWGVALLVFTFGANIQLRAVRTVLAESELVALGQFAATGSLGFLAGIGLGFAVEQALYLAVATALSSTIVGTELLRPEIRQNVVHGRLASSIHFVQDLLAIALVLVLGAETLAADPIATALGYGVMLLVASVLVNQFLFGLLGRVAGDSDELMMVGTVALLVLFIGAAELADISIVVGAFAAGIAVQNDPEAHLGLFNGLTSVTDFFVAIFFVTVGALVTLPTLEVLVAAAVLAVLTAVVKPAVTIALLVHRGYEARSATLTSLGLDQVSEFALIIAIEGLILGALVQPVFDAIILAAAATMITSSLTRHYDEQVYRLLTDRGLLADRYRFVDEHSSVPADIADHVIVLGYGRQGRRLVETCERLDCPYVVVENDPVLRSQLESQCEAYVFGDAMEGYTWERAGLDDARLVVSTVDFERLSDRLLERADGTDVILRSESASTALDLLERGALYVSVSDVLASERLVEHIEALVTGERSPAELRSRHLETLDAESAGGSAP